MLRTSEGATIDEMIAATGWQPHIIRGAIVGRGLPAEGIGPEAVRPSKLCDPQARNRRSLGEGDRTGPVGPLRPRRRDP